MSDGDPDMWQKISVVAINGERERGNGGVVLYDLENMTAKYVMIHELQSAEFVATLEDTLEDDENVNYFVVLEKDRSLHVSKISKAYCLQQYCKDQSTIA